MAGPDLALRQDLFLADGGPMRMYIGAYPGRDALLDLVKACGGVAEDQAGPDVLTFSESPKPGEYHINFVLDSLGEGKMPPLALHAVPLASTAASASPYLRTPDEKRLQRNRQKERQKVLMQKKKKEKEKEKAGESDGGGSKTPAKKRGGRRSKKSTDDVSEPPKKRRGRPPKKKTADESNSAAEPPVKKRRGRPPSKATAVEETEAEAPKKRRGRASSTAAKKSAESAASDTVSKRSRKRVRSPSPTVGNTVRRRLDFASQAPDSGEEWDDEGFDAGAMADDDELSTPPPPKRKKATEESTPAPLRVRKRRDPKKRLRRTEEVKYLGEESEEELDDDVEDLSHLHKSSSSSRRKRKARAVVDSSEEEEQGEDFMEENAGDISVEELDQALDEESQDYDDAMQESYGDEDLEELLQNAIASELGDDSSAAMAGDDVMFDGDGAVVAGTQRLGLGIERNSLERARGIVEHLCRLCARPREVVVHALIVTSGCVEDAYAYIRNPLAYIESRDISQNVWSFSEDAVLLNADPQEMAKVISKRTAEATSARIAFLES